MPFEARVGSVDKQNDPVTLRQRRFEQRGQAPLRAQEEPAGPAARPPWRWRTSSERRFTLFTGDEKYRSCCGNDVRATLTGRCGGSSSPDTAIHPSSPRSVSALETTRPGRHGPTLRCRCADHCGGRPTAPAATSRAVGKRSMTRLGRALEDAADEIRVGVATGYRQIGERHAEVRWGCRKKAA